MSEHETDPQRYAGESDKVAPSGERADEPTTLQQPAVPADGAPQQPAAPADWAPPTPPAPAPTVPSEPAAPAPDPTAGAPMPPASNPPVWRAGQAPVNPAYASGSYGVPPQNPAPGGPQPPEGPGEVPAWAQPAPRPNRFGKVVATGTAALVLAVASGVLGGVIATTLDDDGTTGTGASRTTAAAPVIDRSSLASIAAAVAPSVVSIDTGSGEGSGVVLSADGYILSNNHVVETAQNGSVRVIFADGKSATAKVVGTDPKTDLAVVKAEGVSDLTPAKIGDSDSVQIGDTVLAVGNPLGLQGSVTSGIISAKDRTIQAGSQGTGANSLSGLLQTDAPINPGNSGGALVNTSGEVIGINTAIATNGNSDGNIGVGFAIPSNKAKQVAEQLQKGESVSHPYLGVRVADADNGGATLVSVEPGSPAAKAGLRQGDVVTKLGDHSIGDSDDLVSAVQSGKVGDQLTVTYTRNGDENTATVTLGEAS